MPQEYTMQQALQQAIEAKKELRDFYREAAKVTESPAGRKVLQRLCDEVEENIGKFFKHYQRKDLGSLDEFLARPPHPGSVMIIELRKALDKNVHEKRARELALQEEKALSQSFRLAATRMVDPLARNVFIEVAEEAERHYDMIESEYKFQVTHLHETDVATYVRE